MSTTRKVLAAIALAIVGGIVVLASGWLRWELPESGTSASQPRDRSRPIAAGSASDPDLENLHSAPAADARPSDVSPISVPNPGGPEPHTLPDRPLAVEKEMLPIEMAEEFWAESGRQPPPPGISEQPANVRPPGGGAIASFDPGGSALPPEHGAEQTFDEGEPIQGSDIISSVPELGGSGPDLVPPEAADPGISHPPPEASDPGISYPAPEDSDPGIVYPAPEDGGG